MTTSTRRKVGECLVHSKRRTLYGQSQQTDKKINTMEKELNIVKICIKTYH